MKITQKHVGKKVIRTYPNMGDSKMEITVLWVNDSNVLFKKGDDKGVYLVQNEEHRFEEAPPLIRSLACNFIIADDMSQFRVGDIVDYEVNNRSKGLHYIDKIDKVTNKIHIKDTDGYEHIVSPKNLTTSPKKILSFDLGDIVEWNGILGQIVSITSGGITESPCVWVKCFDGQVMLLIPSQLSLVRKIHNE